MRLTSNLKHPGFIDELYQIRNWYWLYISRYRTFDPITHFLLLFNRYLEKLRLAWKFINNTGAAVNRITHDSVIFTVVCWKFTNSKQWTCALINCLLCISAVRTMWKKWRESEKIQTRRWTLKYIINESLF